ncbi:alpha/beta hydrolase family protein [Pseudoalteromonas ruthenica]|uniref:alpha/beta hydrolase family protein n=1 Tax=Pseudoalteromonas ruthenica TaxID=151081 RepID=UPI00110B0845|nr:S9 family peptidase [Pseudoalteromonas ruthenica]TMO90321.1 S9 family peptidase [Pseudoalteromonas ruthenica]TMP23607.1 S9 family peptidase [Pseudoalteromonas ruthenica]|tara:strand:+ start:61921 stop:63984 length:2064 start_codon:yes stop_codon:yes gene_type:complete
MKLLTTALALATAMGTSLSAQASDTITVEDIPKIKSVIQTAISPDGEQVAFTRSLPRELYVDKNGYNYSELYVVDDEGVERPFITGKVNIKSISWSADGQDIYFLAKLGEDKHTALYHIPVDGGQAQQVFALKGRSISSYELSPTGKQVAILAMPSKDKSEKELKKLGFMAEVYEQGLKNKQLHLIDLAKADKPLDPEAIDIDGYVSDMNYADDGSKLLVKTQPTALIDDKYMKSQWHLFDVQSKAVTLSFKTEGKLGDAELSHDGRYVAILGAEDKHDPATGRLYLADTQSGEIKQWLPDFMGHIADIEWANTENTLNFIAAVSPETFVGQIEVGDEDYDTLIEQGEFIASRLSVSDSDKTIALRANTAKHPNEVFMIRGDEATRLSDSNPWLNDKRFAKQQALSFEARDGVEIGGVLVYPLDYQEGQRYPLIMAVHGGPESHDKNGWVTSYSDPGQMGAARGYAVFYPNYRGSTGKGVAYSKLGQNDYAGKEFDDLVDMKQYLVKMGLVDSDRVGITGGSYGGYASAWGATKLTEHFAASVMFVGVTNQLSKFGTTDISNEMYLVHARSYPWEKWQWYLERSPIYWAGQSKTPLLIMHGKDDPRVHPAQSMELYRYMKVQGKDVRLVYYPGEGHGNRRVAAQYDYSLRLMRWMDNYLMEGNKDMPDYKIDHASKLKAVKDANKAD